MGGGSPLGRADGPADPRSALSRQHARRCWQALGKKGGAEGADSARSGLRILIFEPQSRPERKFTRAFLACWVTGAGGERRGERQPRGPRSPRPAGCGAKSPLPALRRTGGCLCAPAPRAGACEPGQPGAAAAQPAPRSPNCKLCLREAGGSPVQLLPRAVDRFLSPGTCC